MPPTWRQERTPYVLPAGKWLVISDLHVPFHEPVAVEAALKYGKDKKVTGILMNGDMMDCAAVSYWPSAIKRDFDKEVELFIDFLDLLEQEFPKARKVYKMGNHEHRLPRMMQQRVPELAGLPLAAIEAVLGLEERGIDTVDYYEQVQAGKLPILHGHEVARGFTRAVNPARGLFLKAKSWAMCGHYHSTSEHTERNIRGKLLTCWSIGCLCDLSPEYSSINNWNHGFAIVDCGKDGDFFIENRRILPNGVVA
jgi:predicted phosphodiesterase